MHMTCTSDEEHMDHPHPIQAHLAHLRALGLKAEGRTLPVGDALWIARSRGMTSSGVPEEYVLDWVLERKSLQDLLQSIRSAGRYELQKVSSGRLRDTCISRPPDSS